MAQAPTRKVTNTPTFTIAWRLPVPLVLGVNYATSSDVAPSQPNEYEAFARYRPLSAERGAPADVALQLGYKPGGAQRRW